MVELPGIVRVSLPVLQWVPLPTKLGHGFAPPSEIAASNGDLDWAGVGLWVGVVDESAPFRRVTDREMQRRVRQGHPDESPAVVAGRPAVRFEYTDGVARIHSYFVAHPGGATVEFWLRAAFLQSGAVKVDLDETAADVFSHVVWL